MGKANPGQNSFAGGELSPLLEGRQELAKYPIGVRRMRNFLPMIQGPAQKRGGTRFLAEVKDSADRTWLHEFIFSETDAVVIEFGDVYNRFYTDRGSIEATPGTPYEIVSPYAVAYLQHADGSFDLSIVQSSDVLYIANGNYQPRTLSRTSNISWAYALYAPNDGPFDPQNIDDTISVSVGAVTGTTTLANDSAGVPMPSGTTDRLIRIEETDKSAINPWEASKRIASEGQNPANQVRRSDGKVYLCATNATVGAGQIEYRTGTIRPIHTEGTEADGDGKALYSGSTIFAGRVGIDWTYLHAGYGIGRVTAVAGGGLSCTLTVLSRFPASVVSPGSYRYSLGAWYTGNWPESVAFYKSRLTFSKRQRVQMSVSEGYDSHAPDEFGEVLADSAIDINIGIGPNDAVNWMIAQPDGLLVGTGGGEVVIQEITRSQVFGPANVSFKSPASYGSRRVPPINIAEFTLFVQSGGRKVRQAQYSADAERLVAIDITAESEHITRGGLIDRAYCKNPGSHLWFVRADGKVPCLTFQPSEEVNAWSLHDFGGAVESVAAIPGPDAGIDDLYLIVRRVINGQTKRYVEVLLPPYTSPNDPHLSCYMDCSLTYDGSQAVTLTPGTGATVKGAVGVTFTAGSALFSAGDIDREIQVRMYDEDADDDVDPWSTAIAVITGYTSTTQVTCRIVAPFASTDMIAANGWRLTASVLTGYGHLEGETVRIIGDGAAHSDKVVTGGTITLDRQCAIAHAGVPMRSVLQTMNIEAGAQDGTAQGKVGRVLSCTARLFETMGGEMGPRVGKTDPIKYRAPANAMGQALPLFSGDKSLPWPNGFETDRRLTFVHDEGFPCTLLALYPEIVVEDKRQGASR